MLFNVVKSKFLWSTNRPGSPPRRHTFKDSSETDCENKNCLQDKRCMSMPSVTSSSPSSSTSSRSRMLRLQDRRFHQRFPKVHPDERLVNYFSCALVSDILLQGHLFITNNFFAFYSNIFGHKKEILIPIADVVKVTKEKTAKIIPNAVGVYTEVDKYVFGSLLSRDTAYRVIQQTWIQTTDAGLGLPDDSECELSPVLVLMCPGDEDSSVSSGLSGQLTSDEVSLGMTSDISPLVTTPEVMSTVFRSPQYNTPRPSVVQPKEHFFTKFHYAITKKYLNRLEDVITSFSKLSRTSLLFMISTVLLVLLLLSTSVLLYRISLVHQRLPSVDAWYTDTLARYSYTSNSVNEDIELTKLVKSLQERIRHLSQIRQTLEELLLTASKFHSVSRGPAK